MVLMVDDDFNAETTNEFNIQLVGDSIICDLQGLAVSLNSGDTGFGQIKDLVGHRMAFSEETSTLLICGGMKVGFPYTQAHRARFVNPTSASRISSVKSLKSIG